MMQQILFVLDVSWCKLPVIMMNNSQMPALTCALCCLPCSWILTSTSSSASSSMKCDGAKRWIASWVSEIQPLSTCPPSAGGRTLLRTFQQRLNICLTCTHQYASFPLPHRVCGKRNKEGRHPDRWHGREPRGPFSPGHDRPGGDSSLFWPHDLIVVYFLSALKPSV